MALLMPIRYRTMSGGREQAIPAYDATRNQLSAIYASQGLRLPFDGVSVLGYDVSIPSSSGSLEDQSDFSASAV